MGRRSGRGARNQKETTRDLVSWTTSRLNERRLYTPRAHSPLIFRGLLDSSSRPAELQGVVVVGDLRVDRRELVDFQFDFVAISKRSGGHAR